MGSSAPLNTVSHTEGLGVLLVVSGLEDMDLASQVEVEAGYGRSPLLQVEVVASLAVGRGAGYRLAGYYRLVARKTVVLNMGSTNDFRSSEILLHGPFRHIDPFGNNHRDFGLRLPRGPS